MLSFLHGAQTGLTGQKAASLCRTTPPRLLESLRGGCPTVRGRSRGGCALPYFTVRCVELPNELGNVIPIKRVSLGCLVPVLDKIPAQLMNQYQRVSGKNIPDGELQIVLFRMCGFMGFKCRISTTKCRRHRLLPLSFHLSHVPDELFNRMQVLIP